MSKRIHPVEKAPKPVGPYSVAVSFKELLFISGQIPINPQTNEMVSGSFEDEVNQVLINLKNILEECGSSIEDVIKTTVFLTDMKKFPIFNNLYANYFTKNFPARSTLQVSALPKAANIEIEAIAIRKGV